MRSVALAAGCCVLAWAQQVPPVDEGPKDPTFVAFRQKLLEAARDRDKAFVLSILDPEIKVSFGGDTGPKDFERYWELERPETSKLWRELAAVLTLGGRFRDNEFWAPYTYTDFPGGFDAFEYSLIIGKSVNLRARPDAAAPVVAVLSYDVVHTPEYPNQSAFWVKVVTAGGDEGYVARQYVRSPIDYRAAFRKDGDRWILRMLVAGD